MLELLQFSILLLLVLLVYLLYTRGTLLPIVTVISYHCHLATHIDFK